MVATALFAVLLSGAQSAQPIARIPFRIGEDAIIVDAEVNGKSVSLMVDTGFSGGVVVNDAFDMGKPTGSIRLRDFVGEFDAPTVHIQTLKIGSFVTRPEGMDVVLQPMGSLSQVYGVHADGILGIEAFLKFVTEINFEKREFRLYPAGYDVSKVPVDKKSSFLANMLPIGANSIEMEVLAPTGRKMTLALDTGNAFYATTHKDVLQRVGLWQDGRTVKFMRQSGVASGNVNSFQAALKGMQIFGVPVESSVWDVIDAPSSSAEGDGTVGFGFLRNFNITFDYTRRKVLLQNWSGSVGNEPEGELGMLAAWDSRSHAVRVFAVSPGSPAAEAGIRRGDTLLSIDDTELNSAISFRKLHSILNGKVGDAAKLSVSREGDLKRFTLTRVALVNDLTSG